ncbi:hypothetical protein ACFYOF_16910 [Streptomyces sp. NPDC007148]|uniref:hypothetical protein n=1 Tax=Streptomyces sp. NPDC007148 TaxID=3364775 RepID=UPI0036C99CF3
MSTPPPVGKNASVKVDQALYDDLTTMLATGMTVSDAVRSALRIVAGTYRKAWEHTTLPHGVRPTIARYFLTRYDPAQAPERGSMQTTVPEAYWMPTTVDHTGMTGHMTPRPTVAPDDTTGLPRSYPLLPAGRTGPSARPTPSDNSGRGV